MTSENLYFCLCFLFSLFKCLEIDGKELAVRFQDLLVVIRVSWLLIYAFPSFLFAEILTPEIV